jgi:drug/metabolite transporter (DMT)-like permease
MSYLLIAATIGLTVAGQLLVKAGMIEVGSFPGQLDQAWSFMFNTLTNVKVLLGLTSAVLAALCWTAAVSVSDISFAYPFIALAIVLVLALSGLVFRESVPIARWMGVAIVCVGLVVAARG